MTASAPCSMVEASSWIRRWFEAWELTSRETLGLHAAPAPELVFFDSSCIYTTSAVAAGGSAPVGGPDLLGNDLPWRSLAHEGSITLPDGFEVPAQLMSFASATDATGPFFVMAAPLFWNERGHDDELGLTGVFLHEFAHTRQLEGLALMLVVDRLYPEWPRDTFGNAGIGAIELLEKAVGGSRR